MGQLVDEHKIAASNQRRDDARIRAYLREEHTWWQLDLDDERPRFELGEQRMVAGHQAGGAGAHAVDAQRLDRRFLDGGMMGQVEVVVAAEREQPAPVAQGPDSGHASRIDERPAQ